MAFNTTVDVLTSAARTATVNSDWIKNRHTKAMHVVINVTSITATPSITPKIEGCDPISGTAYTILEGLAMTATGTQVLKVGLGIAASANASAQDMIPSAWRVTVTHADTDSITYSVAANITDSE